MILQEVYIVQNDARAERANSTYTYSVAIQVFNLVILQHHIIVLKGKIQQAEFPTKEMKKNRYIKLFKNANFLLPLRVLVLAVTECLVNMQIKREYCDLLRKTTEI